MSVFKQLSSNKLQNKDIGLQKFWRAKQAMSLPQAKACTFFTMHFIRKITTYFRHIKKVVSGFHGLSGMFIYTKKHVIKSGDIITNSFSVSNVKKAK